MRLNPEFINTSILFETLNNSKKRSLLFDRYFWNYIRYHIGLCGQYSPGLGEKVSSKWKKKDFNSFFQFINLLVSLIHRTNRRIVQSCVYFWIVNAHILSNERSLLNGEQVKEHEIDHPNPVIQISCNTT